MPKVTVIIPNYNHSHFLKLRIDSVLNQSYQDFEVIILDDCSTDDSNVVIEQYRNHPKIAKIVYNEVNSGTTFKQWRKGIDLANGDYIWIAESDDFAAPNLLETLVPVIEGSTNLGLVYCNSLVVDEKGEVTDNTRRWYSNVHGEGKSLHTSGIVKGRKFCLDHLVYNNTIPNASAVLFKKQIVLDNLEWIDKNLRNAGDWKLWINILLRYDFGYVSDDLNYFRKHSSNVTGSLLRVKLEILRILKEIAKTTNNKSELYKIFDSIFIWSFRQAYWVDGYALNHSNIRFYFSNNLNFKSIRYFFYFGSLYFKTIMRKDNL